MNGIPELLKDQKFARSAKEKIGTNRGNMSQKHLKLNNTRVKANAHYTCQECGSTELIQAHHRIPKDDSTLICLCAECHSNKHPDIPKALFFTRLTQPYWSNKSASSLAKENNLHPRTIIRRAKKLGLLNIGILTPESEMMIINFKKIIRPTQKQKFKYTTMRVTKGTQNKLRQLFMDFNDSYDNVLGRLLDQNEKIKSLAG